MLLLAPLCRDCHNPDRLFNAPRQRRVAEIVMTLVEMLLLVVYSPVTASRSVTREGLHAPGRNLVEVVQHFDQSARPGRAPLAALCGPHPIFRISVLIYHSCRLAPFAAK